jgi:hypothetical protein
MVPLFLSGVGSMLSYCAFHFSPRRMHIRLEICRWKRANVLTAERMVRDRVTFQQQIRITLFRSSLRVAPTVISLSPFVLKLFGSGLRDPSYLGDYLNCLGIGSLVLNGEARSKFLEAGTEITLEEFNWTSNLSSRKLIPFNVLFILHTSLHKNYFYKKLYRSS